MAGNGMTRVGAPPKPGVTRPEIGAAHTLPQPSQFGTDGV
jgi:hypothetical protein